MPNIPHISDREWTVMTKLWEKHPQTAAEIVAKVQAEIGVGDSSIRTLLGRLVKKNAVSYRVDEGNANLYHYYPIVCEQDCVRKKTRHFLELYYKNNIAKLFAAFVEDGELPDEEIGHLREMLDRKMEESR